jgi:hypothetical protein
MDFVHGTGINFNELPTFDGDDEIVNGIVGNL